MIEQIEKHLASEAEATAKGIAAALGLPHVEVSKALHKMVSTGTIEREKRAGGGNEYVYWLARGAPPALPVAASAANASEPLPGEAAAIDVLGDPDARPAPVNFPCWVAPVVADDVVDAEIRMSDLFDTIKTLTGERDAALQKAEDWRATAAKLEARIDELTLGPPGAAAPLFVTIGRNAPPKRHSSLEKAQRRGAALIRADKETEVLVLEPVGRIVRGSEWRPR
ncbi:1-pyrroline-5-carboxylate dehydrogenase [Burkholderia gladioli]|uniref:1-pyrroline-5-carboxylate dehydrogenase n=1 Tax=Burkholderia gladioli TaxID=28095 RepID=UPI0016410BF8|nr:1-pyrroline-5-carboxylate dehydrogenase [Burkholderia gladioli]